MTAKEWILQNIMRREKILKGKLRRVVDPSKKVPDLNCEVQNLLLEVVDLKQEIRCDPPQRNPCS